jgi:hypothetical protein
MCLNYVASRHKLDPNAPWEVAPEVAPAVSGSGTTMNSNLNDDDMFTYSQN